MAEYIEREAAIEFLRLNYCKDCNSYNGVRCRACSFDDAMLAIEDVPTADVVEVKHGRWETRNFIIFDSEKVGYRCTECKTTWDTETNYCPYCGADMRKEGADNDS